LLGAPGVAAMIEHHALLYADLADPVALLRREGGGGHVSGYWPYAEGGAPCSGEGSAYSALMSASQAMVAGQLLAAYPIARHRRLLDVGGGHGTFIRAVAAKAPELQLSLFDLPPVAAEARRRFAADRLPVEVFEGSFFDNPLPEGADVVSLVRILHDHDDAEALRILHAVRRALPHGGTLLVAEPMSGAPGAERVGDAYFGFYLLAMGSGRPRAPAEIRAMLRTAGFASTRQVLTTMPLITQLIVAR
jgi:demethylspheroidene O-methyltransferase